MSTEEQRAHWRKVYRNRLERKAADRYEMAICANCGLARLNVVHHVTPEQQAWAGDSGYFDDMTDLHPFEADSHA